MVHFGSFENFKEPVCPKSVVLCCSRIFMVFVFKYLVLLCCSTANRSSLRVMF